MGTEWEETEKWEKANWKEEKEWELTSLAFFWLEKIIEFEQNGIMEWLIIFWQTDKNKEGKSWKAHSFSPLYKGHGGDRPLLFSTHEIANESLLQLELSDSSVKTVKFQQIANHKNQVDRNCKLMGKCTPKMKPWNCCLSSRSLQGTRGMWDNWEMVTLAIKDAEAKFSNWRTESLSPFTPVPLVSVKSQRIRLLDMFCGRFTLSLKKKKMWLVTKQEYKTCYEKKKFLMKTESKRNWSTEDNV